MTTLAAIRSILLVAVVLGLVGTGIELLLLGHVEALAQLIPLGLIAAALLALAWFAIRRKAPPMRVFQVLMTLFVVAGGVGILLHFWSNIEFEKEMYPTMEGMELFRKAATGATPALAPGTMIEIGLLGLAYAYRHPALTGSTRTGE